MIILIYIYSAIQLSSRFNTVVGFGANVNIFDFLRLNTFYGVGTNLVSNDTFSIMSFALLFELK
jgi:hypothetical protein